MIARFLKHTIFFFLVAGLFLQANASFGEGLGRPKPVTLKVAVLPYLSYAPFFIAQEEAYFTEQGLQIETVRFAHSPDAIPAIIRGKLDVAGGFVTVNMLNAMAHGARIRFVADKSYCDPTGCVYMGLIARRALLEGGDLDKTAQMKDRRIAINEASIEGYWVEKLLRTGGLMLKDVHAGDVPDAAMLGAFKKGALDLATPAEPWLTLILKAGDTVLWMPIQKVVPDFQFGIILFGPTLLDKDPDAGKRFMVAYMKAVQQYNQGKTERNLDIVVKHTGLDRVLLEQACWPAFRANGRINTQSILDFQAWAVEKGYLEKTITEEHFWEPGFAEYAKQVLNTPAQ